MDEGRVPSGGAAQAPLRCRSPLLEGLRVEQIDAWVQPRLLHSRLCGLSKVSPSTTLTPHGCWKDLVRQQKSSGSHPEGAGPPHTHSLGLVPEVSRGEGRCSARHVIHGQLSGQVNGVPASPGRCVPPGLRPASYLAGHSMHPASPRPEATLFPRQHYTHVTGEETEGQITF